MPTFPPPSQTLTEEQSIQDYFSRNPAMRLYAPPPPTGDDSVRAAASMLPGIGNVLSAQDAWNAAPGVLAAAKAGDIRGQRAAAAETLAGVLGAILGLPIAKLAGPAAKGAKDSVNMFLGPAAKNADLAALDTARSMEAASKPRADTLNDTGWFRGADGRWRWETDDSKAALAPEAAKKVDEGLFRTATTGRQDKLMQHPEFFSNYEDAPFDREMVIKRGKTYGSHDNQTGAMRVQGEDSEDALSTALHELQHGVQKRENFAHGANPSELRPDIADGDPYDLYHRTAGEVEARNVQARRKLTAQERRAIPPWATQDVPDDQQIVRIGKSWQPRYERSFVPVEDAQLADSLRDMRASGTSNAGLFREKGGFFDAAGRPVREIPDKGMKIKTSRVWPGETTALGDVVEHPQLFDAMPALRKTPVTWTDKLDTKGGRSMPIARTLPDTGGLEVSLAGDDPIPDLAKLLQYTIAGHTGGAKAVRHASSSLTEALESAALKAKDTFQPGVSDIDPLAAYLQSIKNASDKYKELLTTKNPAEASRRLAAHMAGNVDAKIVRTRAKMGNEGVFPYSTDQPGLPRGPKVRIPGYERIIVTPQQTLTREEMAKMIRDWRIFGSGRKTGGG